ncbi:uncharacterized protein LOC134565372 isoform X2 [Prinia subflava]|uniref:uncharacterized protein LOC134565372 isoform X2 n=1 Tax=Prinia subflava TaxID=208062 RepID=UPI002FE0F27B
MEPREVLEVLVAVIATLGELAAVVAGSDEDVLRAESRESLRGPLRKFTWTLRCTLRRHHVPPLGHRGVTPLGQALTALEATPGATWADVRAAVRAWQDSVDALAEIWLWVVVEAAKLCTNPQKLYTRSGQWSEVASGLLRRLLAACDKATVFPWELLRRLRDIEAALDETREASPYVPEALVAAVAEAEQLWEASTCLTTRHLLGTLADICALLSSHPDVPGGHAVAEQCQRAIKDIPRLLRTQQGPVIRVVTPSGTSLGSLVPSSLPAWCLRQIWGTFWEFSLKLSQILMGILGLTSLGTLRGTQGHTGTLRNTQGRSRILRDTQGHGGRG